MVVSELRAKCRFELLYLKITFTNNARYTNSILRVHMNDKDEKQL